MPAPTPYNLQNLFADVAHFQEVMGRIQSSLRNPEDKARLGELLERVEKARAAAEEQVPAILQEKKQKIEQARAAMEELQQKIDTMKEDLKAQKAAKAAKEAAAAQPEDGKAAAAPGAAKAPLPTLPEVPINPALGEDLRLEVLKKYGGLVIH